MTQTKPDWARLRPLFVLEQMPRQLRSDVLEDGSIISACGFTTKPQVQDIDEMVVIRDELFAAFRNASKVPLACRLHAPNNALIDATISINEDGSATVEIAGKKKRFAWAALLSPDADTRLAHLDQFLRRYRLYAGDVVSLRTLVARADFTDDDFLAAVTLFQSSPETFMEQLTEKVRHPEGKNRIAPVDVIPEDERYWNHLLPPVAGSTNLTDYIGQELNGAWGDGLEADPVRELHALAVTFAAPELVPRATLQRLDADAAAKAIDAVSKVDDPFSLVGTFEICAERAAQDERFVAFGDRILDSLFGDMDRLTRACALFGAIFVITTAHFATNETLQRRPVFWRRLAGATHASQIVRVIDGNGVDPNEIMSWAMRLFGDAYYLSVVSDFAVEPQWRPEWISSKILVADVFGRAAGAWSQRSQEAVPPSWKERIDDACAWVVAEKIQAFTHYPSVLQGIRRAHRPTLAELQLVPQAADAFLDLANDPTARTLLSISPFIEALGFSNESTGDVEKVLANIRSGPPEDDNIAVPALSLLAHIANLTENGSLADGVSELCVERARRAATYGSMFEIVCRLVECTAVMKDRREAARTLAHRLEILAFITPASEAAEGLASSIEMLKRIQPNLAPLLGRALSAARLGCPRAAANSLHRRGDVSRHGEAIGWKPLKTKLSRAQHFRAALACARLHHDRPSPARPSARAGRPALRRRAAGPAPIVFQLGLVARPPASRAHALATVPRALLTGIDRSPNRNGSPEGLRPVRRLAPAR